MWLTVTAAWLRLQGQNARPRAQGADESDDGGARRLLRSHVAAAAAAAAAASGAAASAHHKQAAGQVRGFQSQAWGPCACSCSLQERREATYSAHASALGLLWASSKHITNIVGQCQSLCTVAVRTCSPAAQGGDAPLSLSVVRVRASAPVGASLPRRGGRRRPAMPSQCPPARRPRARRQPPCSSTRARGRRSREPRLGHPPWPASVGGRARRAPRGHAKPAKRRAAHELAASWQPRGRPLVSAARSVPRRLGCERREGRAAGRRAVVAACVISRVERGCERHGGGLRQLIAAPRVREAGHGGRCLLPHASRPGMPSVHRAGAARGAVLGGAGPASGGCRER